MHFKNLPLTFLLLFIFTDWAIAQDQNTQEKERIERERKAWPSLKSEMGLSGRKTPIGVKIITRVDYILSGNPEHPLKPYRYSYVLTNTGKFDIFADWETLNFLFDGPFGGPLFFKLKKGESRKFFFYSDQRPVETAGKVKILIQDGKYRSIFYKRLLSPSDDFLPKVRTSGSKKNILVFVSGGLATAYFPRDLWFEIKEIRENYEKSR